MKQVLVFKRVRKYFIVSLSVTPKGELLFKVDPDGPKASMKEAEKEVFSRSTDEWSTVYTILPTYGLEERVITVDKNGDEQENFPFIAQKERGDYE